MMDFQSAESVEQLEAYLEEVRLIAQRARNLQHAGEVIADDFNVMMAEQFRTEGEFLSGGWEATNTGRPILVDTGRLRESLRTPSHEDHIREVTGEHVTIGSSVEYGQYHQTGTGNLPRRQIIELRDEDVDRWTRIVEAYLHGGDPQAEMLRP